jgi:hypothetical protein
MRDGMVILAAQFDTNLSQRPTQRIGYRSGYWLSAGQAGTRQSNDQAARQPDQTPQSPRRAFCSSTGQAFSPKISQSWESWE